MKLAAIFKPKTAPESPPAKAPGKHSAAWPAYRIAELERKLAAKPDLVEVHCMAGNAVHPVWWTVEAPGDCPWCVAERLALELQFLRPTAPGGPPMVPAPKDMPGYGLSASTAAKTRQDATLASLVESDEDRDLLSALGHSIPAPVEAADTLLLDLSRLHGPSETAILPAVPTLDLDPAGHNRGPHPAYRKVPCSSPMTGPQRMLPAVVEPDALPPVTWGTEQQPVVPQLKAPLPDEADTVRLPVVESVVPLWHNLTPVSLRAGDNANKSVTDAVEDQLHDQLANAT